MVPAHTCLWLLTPMFLQEQLQHRDSVLSALKRNYDIDGEHRRVMQILVAYPSECQLEDYQGVGLINGKNVGQVLPQDHVDFLSKFFRKPSPQQQERYAEVNEPPAEDLDPMDESDADMDETA